MDAANYRDMSERAILFLRTVHDPKGKTGNGDEYNVTHKRWERNIDQFFVSGTEEPRFLKE